MSKYKTLPSHIFNSVTEKPTNFIEDIIKASAEGDLESVQYLVEQCGADANCANEGLFTPLYEAAFHNHLDVVQYLVEKAHADINKTGRKGKTAFGFAARNNNLDVVRYFVENCHAEVNSLTNFDCTHR